MGIIQEHSVNEPIINHLVESCTNVSLPIAIKTFKMHQLSDVLVPQL
jgi:hypothetical protein